MYKITTGERMLQHLVVEYEKVSDPRLPACSRKAGKLLETCCSIMDLKGVGLYNLNQVYGYVKQASAISQNYYPERLGRLYLINAPWGFSTVFSVVKGFLDPVTVEKIHVLGGGYQTELLKQIPKENLPKLFGGECDCPGGCAWSDLGPWQEKEWARPPKWMQEGNTPTKTSESKTTKTTKEESAGDGKDVTVGQMTGQTIGQGQTTGQTTEQAATGKETGETMTDEKKEEEEAIRVAREIMQSGPSPTQTTPAPAQPGATTSTAANPAATVPQAVNAGSGTAAAPVPGAAPAPM